jgi:hypothetical protein
MNLMPGVDGRARWALVPLTTDVVSSKRVDLEPMVGMPCHDL